MCVSDAIRAAAGRLSATSDTARLDAELLMAHALGLGRSDMLVRSMRDPAPAGFAALVERRAGCEPVAYITGKTEFYGLELAVAPGVLIPRPDSETLIEAAREAFEGRHPPARILDLGTGSGALLFAALSLFPEAEGYGIDASRAVAPTFLANRARHGPDALVGFTLLDWREPGWSDNLGLFDLILCNPPYVEEDADLAPDVRAFEPASALFAGADGLDDYRILIPQLRGLMNEGAVAILEIGHTQGEAVIALAQGHGFKAELRQDLANRPRAVVLH